MLQFHGDEGPSFCAEAGRRTGCRVIKAARVRSRAEIQALAPFHTDFHLLDTYVDGCRAGPARRSPGSWRAGRTARPRVPVILAGGLTADNVAEAIATVRPVCGRRRQRHRVGPGDQGPRQAAGVRRRRCVDPARRGPRARAARRPRLRSSQRR